MSYIIVLLALIIISPLWDYYWTRVIIVSGVLSAWGLCELTVPFIVRHEISEQRIFMALIYSLFHIALTVLWLACIKRSLAWLKKRPYRKWYTANLMSKLND